jgi:hypothetical protein
MPKSLSGRQLSAQRLQRGAAAESLPAAAGSIRCLRLFQGLFARKKEEERGSSGCPPFESPLRVSGSTVSVGTSVALQTGAADTVGTLATGNETWNGGGNYLWKTTGNGSAFGSSGANGSDLLALTGVSVSTTSGNPFTIAIGGNSTLPVGAAGATNNTFTIAKVSGNVTVNGTPETPSVGSPIIFPTNNQAANAFALNTSAFQDNGVPLPGSAFTLELVADPAPLGKLRPEDRMITGRG